MTNAIHPFERAGLGKAPFRCVGFYESKYQACQGAPIQPGSSCDYCSQGIMNVFRIKGADGKEFKVGCDCVAKTTDACAKTDAERAARALQTQVNRIKTAALNARKDEQIAAALAKLVAYRDALADETVEIKGVRRNLIERLDWIFAHAGRAGKVAAVKMLDAAVADLEARRARIGEDTIRHERDGGFLWTEAGR
jgi:hypothetical protein